MSPDASPYADLDRPPLSEPALRAALLRPGGLWSSVRVLTRTGSTNTDLLDSAAEHADGTVLIAEEQSAGRGRLDRQWTSPARAGLTCSMLIRPRSDRAQWGWLPLLTGVAVATAVSRLGEVRAVLKWPNDLLLGGGKAAGILLQSSGPAVVIGFGLNVSTRPSELPEGAASLASVQAACTDRDPLLRAILREFAHWYDRFEDAGGDAEACGLRDAYRRLCDTLDRTVRVAVPSGTDLLGTAVDIAPDGGLVIATSGGVHTVAAGDVTHVRPV